VIDLPVGLISLWPQRAGTAAALAYLGRDSTSQGFCLPVRIVAAMSARAAESTGGGG
jgi:hypothetical protein